MSVRSCSAYELFLPDKFTIHQGLHWRAVLTDFTLVGAFIVVVIDPLVQIDLQVLDGLINLVVGTFLAMALLARRRRSIDSGPIPLKWRCRLDSGSQTLLC